MTIKHACINLLVIYSLVSCSPAHQISRSAKKVVLQNHGLKTAHVGISIYEPAGGKYLYNYQGDHYFVPASNTKIPTCFAAMKYLGDSLVGLMIGIPEELSLNENTLIIKPAGDPSFLHTDFSIHPAFNYLYQKVVLEHRQPFFYLDSLQVERWGNGWSWNDYDQAYMAERSSLPIFGNTITIRLRDSNERFLMPAGGMYGIAKPFYTGSHYFDSVVNSSAMIREDELKKKDPLVSIYRTIDQNNFLIEKQSAPFKTREFPFVTHGSLTAVSILSDSLGKEFKFIYPSQIKGTYSWASPAPDRAQVTIKRWQKIHSQPTDTLLKLMMHRSDNFFAEQSLLMAANEYLDQMDQSRMIDTLLKTDFRDLPQKPRWVDGSGLSRYNLFSPRDLVMILDKMRSSFGMERLKSIFATGNEGTLTNYYKSSQGYIFAKTGTLSGVVAISGYLYSRKNRLLIFSVLVNNHQTSATEVRRAIEKFIEGVRDRY